MDFLRNLTKYSPKKFKNKSVKEILSLDSGKVPDNFFTREYAEKYAKEFANANLTDDQLNAIELLSDLKKKVEKILTKCYTETGRASKLPKGQEQAKPADQMQAKQEQAKQEQAKQEQAKQEQAKQEQAKPAEEQEPDIPEDDEEEDSKNQPAILAQAPAMQAQAPAIQAQAPAIQAPAMQAPAEQLGEVKQNGGRRRRKKRTRKHRKSGNKKMASVSRKRKHTGRTKTRRRHH